MRDGDDGPDLTAGCRRQDLEAVAVGYGRVDRITVEHFAVHTQAHEAAKVALTVEYEFAKPGMPSFDRLDARPYGIGIDLDQAEPVRGPPIPRRNLYLRHFCSLRVRRVYRSRGADP